MAACQSSDCQADIASASHHLLIKGKLSTNQKDLLLTFWRANSTRKSNK